MPSSTSSSEGVLPLDLPRAGFVRLTAADRPGVAQPVPERDIPEQPWPWIWLGAAILALLLIGAWEWRWRAFGVIPSYRNSDGQWASQRRRIDHGEGNKTVLIGSSRVLFDVQLPVWQRIAGERPIQLAMEGTTPLPMLEDLAADPKFTGRLVVGIAPLVFFSGHAMRADVVPFARKQSPSQRVGNWLSMHLLEPYLAFDDPDFALATVIQRQPWPVRVGTHPYIAVRKLANADADRNTRMWSKLQTDAGYRALARRIWSQQFSRPPPRTGAPVDPAQLADAQIRRAAAAVAQLRARGVPVVFVRPPSTGPFLAFEEKVLPRARSWDVLLAHTHAAGIHFADYPQLGGYEQPEWSHIAAPDADRFTAALVPLVAKAFAIPAAHAPAVSPVLPSAGRPAGRASAEP